MRAASVATVPLAIAVGGCGGSPHTPVISGYVHVESATVRAGGVLQTEIVLRNRSRRDRVLAVGCPHGFVLVVLSRGSTRSADGWALPGCSDARFVAHAGTTIYPERVIARYGGCLQPGGRSLTPIPRCIHGDREPRLPPGVYTVSVAASSQKLQRELAHVRPGRVRVIR